MRDTKKYRDRYLIERERDRPIERYIDIESEIETDREKYKDIDISRERER